MKAFFSNFIVVVVLIGALTRVLNLVLSKKINREYIATFAISILILFPLVSIFLGFDLAISTYLPTLLVWLLIDHIYYQVGKKP